MFQIAEQIHPLNPLDNRRWLTTIKPELKNQMSSGAANRAHLVATGAKEVTWPDRRPKS